MNSPRAHEAVLSIEYDTPRRAEIVAESVAREVGEIDDERSRTTIDRVGETVVVEIAARDPVSLRAALNSWLSLLEVAGRIEGIATRESDAVERGHTGV